MTAVNDSQNPAAPDQSGDRQSIDSLTMPPEVEPIQIFYEQSFALKNNQKPVTRVEIEILRDAVQREAESMCRQHGIAQHRAKHAVQAMTELTKKQLKDNLTQQDQKSLKSIIDANLYVAGAVKGGRPFTKPSFTVQILAWHLNACAIHCVNESL
jgi:molecular chaperone DnaK (HSP70)